ncbi:MAG: YdcF family protein [Clostridia bacterium]|nr:YdcF family protein [Clostridia bacterium]
MKRKKFICISLVALFSLLLYLFVTACGIYTYGKVDAKQESDVAIILGAAADSEGVSPVYAERIRHGIWLYENGYVDYVILTGGKGEGNDFSDAAKAREFALSQGLPESVILLEEQSRITQENLQYSKKLMEERGLSSCILVSDPLHMKRAMLMAKDYGMNACSSPTPTTKYRSWKTKLPFLLREEFFYIGYQIYSFLF